MSSTQNYRLKLGVLNFKNNLKNDLKNNLKNKPKNNLKNNPTLSTCPGDPEQPPEVGEVKTPYQYFTHLITDEMFKKVEVQTSLYSIQKDGITVNTTQKEIDIFFGIYLRMGLVQALVNSGAAARRDCRDQPFVQCLTCKVCLCLNKERNCFILFHKK
ncbi:hypothetical protein ACOMHN_001959 [Nucella lapillus]